MLNLPDIKEQEQPEQDKIKLFIANKIPKPIRAAFNFSESALEYGLSLPTTIAMFGAIFNKNYSVVVYPAVTFTMGIVGGILKTDIPLFRKAGLSEDMLEEINFINEEASHILGRYNSAQELAFHVSGLFINGSWNFTQYPNRKAAFAATIIAPAALALFTGSEKIYLSALNLSQKHLQKLKNALNIQTAEETQPLINAPTSDIAKTRLNTRVPLYIYTALNAGFSAYEFSAIPILVSGFNGYRYEVAFAESNYGHYGRLGIAGGAAVLIGILDYCLQHLEKTNASAKMYRNAVNMAIRVAMYLALMLDFAFDFNYSVKKGDYVSYPVGSAITVGIMLLMIYLNKQPAPTKKATQNPAIQVIVDSEYKLPDTGENPLTPWLARKTSEMAVSTKLSKNRNSSFSLTTETPKREQIIVPKSKQNRFQ